MAKQTVEDQIKNQQKDTWEMAEQCDSNQMKVTDQIFEKGLVVAETEALMNMFNDESSETKKVYLVILNELRKFYNKILKSQQMVS
jgi:hypothetical protein